MLQSLARLELDEREFFAGTGLNRQRLCEGKNIAMDDFLQLLINAWNTPQGERLGLLLGQRANIFVLGAVGHAAASAPSIRDGLHLLEAFSRLHASYIRLELQSHIGGMEMVIRFLHPLRETERFHLETAFALFQHYVEMMSGEPLTDGFYRFPYAPPDYAADYATLFHSPCEFQSKQAQIHLPSALLDTVSPFHDATVWRQSRLQLAKHLQQITSLENAPYSQHLLALLNSRHPPLPKLGDMAAMLHMSERTLNRRLLGEGVRFRDLKTEITQQWAREYLLHSAHSVETISSLLGYEDVANFRRAFRKHQGCGPQVFRESHGQI